MSPFINNPLCTPGLLICVTVNRVGESLGSGQYGEVYCGRWLAGRGGPVEVVIKTFSPEKGKNNLEFLREADINARFVHPNIVRLYGVVLSDPVSGEMVHYLCSFHMAICVDGDGAGVLAKWITQTFPPLLDMWVRNIPQWDIH